MMQMERPAEVNEWILKFLGQLRTDRSGLPSSHRPCRCTCTSPGACASARTATSTPTPSAASSQEALPRAARPRSCRPGCRGRRTHRAVCSWAGARRACSRRASIGRRAGSGAPRTLARCRDAEVTLEANPGTIERGLFAEYRAAGVNRVSLGAQSFDAAHAAGLGPHPFARGHAHRGRGAARRRPRQLQSGPDVRAARAGCRRRHVRDVEAALALGPAHLSHYQLTLEPGTVFAAQPPPLPDEDVAAPDAQRLRRAARRRPALRSTRYRPMRGRGGSAATTSTTGISATTSGSAPARTASSPSRASGEIDAHRCSRASRAAILPRTAAQLARRAHPGGRAAVRIHAECAAADGRIRALRLFSRPDRPCLERHCRADAGRGQARTDPWQRPETCGRAPWGCGS